MKTGLLMMELILAEDIFNVMLNHIMQFMNKNKTCRIKESHDRYNM